jgi:hypothetical protein
MNFVAGRIQMARQVGNIGLTAAPRRQDTFVTQGDPHGLPPLFV